MPDAPKPFCLLNSGAELAVFKLEGTEPWFRIQAKHCAGQTVEQKQEAFNEAVKFQVAAFGPLADYKQLRQATLPEIPG